MSDKSVTVSADNSWFFLALCLLFVGLKLTGYIDWSWWWVLAPIWIPIAAGLGIGVVILIYFLLRPSSGGKR